MNYQKIILIGNATAATKVEKPEGKTTYADLTVAVSRGREETDYFPVRAFGALAEGAAKIKKGAKVLVEGRVVCIHCALFSSSKYLFVEENANIMLRTVECVGQIWYT